ncbi:MAG: hypothetical protein U0871_00320 [Gemmataceae bacterium]
MSTKPTSEATVSDKNRFSRQIDKAFEEASKLAGSSLPPTEFYEKFLNSTLSAIDAPAGVVWLRTPQGFLQIAQQINLDKIGLDAKRGGRQCHNEILRQVFQSQPMRPQMVEPQGRLTGVSAEPGTVPAANLTDYYALFAPIVNPDKSPLGLLEVFHDPALDPRLYQTFLQYAVQMAGYASQYHQFSTGRQSAGLERVFTQIEAFAKQIHGTLNPTEVAYHVANEGRRLVECDRLCVGVRHGQKVTVEAVSGADVVEKASTHVRRMRNLFDAVVKFNDKLVYKGTKDEGLPPDLSHALDEYLAESQPKLLVVAPVRDDREKDSSKPARSVLLMESFNPPEQVEPLISKLEVVGKHSASALYNASELQRVPFRFLWKPVGLLQEALGGKHRFYWIMGIVAAIALITALCLVPYPLKLDAKGEFMPTQVQFIYPPHEGEVREVLVKPGETLRTNAPVVGLYSPQLLEQWTTLANELTTAQGRVRDFETQLRTKARSADDEMYYIKEINTSRAKADSTARRLADMQQRYGLDGNRPGVFAARAPAFDPAIPRTSDTWRVLSGDVRNELTRRTVRMHEPLVRLGVVDGPWRVELKIPQRNIGHIAYALATKDMHKTDPAGKPYLDVDVLLTSAPDSSFPGRLYKEDMALEAVPDRGDHNQNEPIVQSYVRVNLDEPHIPRELFVAGQETHIKVRCGTHPAGYALFHGVWEWFYEHVLFYF